MAARANISIEQVVGICIQSAMKIRLFLCAAFSLFIATSASAEEKILGMGVANELESLYTSMFTGMV